jgi:hypothetical protein
MLWVDHAFEHKTAREKRYQLRIPTKPAGYSDLKAATIPI